MAGISVSVDEIMRRRQLVQGAVHSIETVQKKLLKRLQSAGDSWEDKNYRKLENIAIECSEALQKTFQILVEADKYLESVEETVFEYENALNSGSAGFRRQIAQAAGRQGGKKSRSQKMQELKKGLASVDDVLNGYKKELMGRGMSDGDAMNAFLQYYRHQLQGDLLRSINGETVVPAAAPDFDAVASGCIRSGIDRYHSSSGPRKLSATEYGFTDIVFEGRAMRVYDDPLGTAALLIRSQGNSHYPMSGTCGLCQAANILTMAGVSTDEDAIISQALHSSDSLLESMDVFENCQSERGGTTVRDRQELLERCGVPVTNVPVDSDRNRTVRQLAAAVASGHGVIVSVDVERLWRNGQRGGHAISLLSVTSDASTFLYSDTGTGEIAAISASELAAALTGRPANVTTNVIR